MIGTENKNERLTSSPFRLRVRRNTAKVCMFESSTDGRGGTMRETGRTDLFLVALEPHCELGVLQEVIGIRDGRDALWQLVLAVLVAVRRHGVVSDWPLSHWTTACPSIRYSTSLTHHRHVRALRGTTSTLPTQTWMVVGAAKRSCSLSPEQTIYGNDMFNKMDEIKSDGSHSTKPVLNGDHLIRNAIQQQVCTTKIPVCEQDPISVNSANLDIVTVSA